MKGKLEKNGKKAIKKTMSQKFYRGKLWNRTSHGVSFLGDHENLQGFVYTYDSITRANPVSYTHLTLPTILLV